MKPITMLLCVVALIACRTVKETTTTMRDTSVRTRVVMIPFDTAVKMTGNHVLWDSALPIEHGVPRMEPKEVRQGNLSAVISVIDGRLRVEARTEDTTLRVKGNVAAPVQDTTIHEKTTTTETVAQSKWASFWSGIWQSVRGYILLICIVLAAVILLFGRFIFGK